MTDGIKDGGAAHAKTCAYGVEEYPGGFACTWSVGRPDVPPHISDGGYWLEKDGCDNCPCYTNKAQEGK